MISTGRLILRPWNGDDAEALFRCAHDPDVGPAAGWPPHESVEESRYVINNTYSAPENYAICLKSDGVPIGCISLLVGKTAKFTDKDDECELGYWLAKPFWGNGIATEAAGAILDRAFDTLKMRRVWCGFYSGNLRSRAVMLKLGFVYSYTLERFEVPLLNDIRIAHVACITKKQWRSARRKMTLSTYLKITE